MPSVAEVPQTVDLHRWHGRMLPGLMAAVLADAALYRGEGTASVGFCWCRPPAESGMRVPREGASLRPPCVGAGPAANPMRP